MSEATEILLQINLVFWLVYGIGILAAIIYVVVKVNGFIRHINARVDPVVKQVEDTVGKVTAAAQTVANEAEHIAHSARTTADHIVSRVETASEVIRDTVVGPAIGINSLFCGARRAAETLRDRWAHRGRRATEEPASGED